MYKYGQFVKTPKGRFRIRKAIKVSIHRCFECEAVCICTVALCKFCIKELPGDAYLEKPKIRGGKSTTSKQHKTSSR